LGLGILVNEGLLIGINSMENPVGSTGSLSNQKGYHDEPFHSSIIGLSTPLKYISLTKVLAPYEIPSLALIPNLIA
jgi:hypothetical protein